MNVESFSALAPKLAAYGYEPVPIVRGTKACKEQGWQHGGLAERAAEFQQHYTGILTAECPAVDIDVSDPALVRQLEAIVLEVADCHELPPPARVGMAPRRLLLFRTEEPFAKVTTRQYALPTDPADKPSKVEILGNGQQFVAYAVHPDTQKPYTWNGSGEPLQLRRAALPVLNEPQAKEIVRRAELLLSATSKATEPPKDQKHDAEDDLVSRIARGENLHDNVLRLVGFLKAKGIGDKTIRSIVRAVVEQARPVRGDRVDELVGAELDRMIAGADKYAPQPSEPWSLPAPIAPAEFDAARGTPDCIVENYLYTDVAELVAPGGTGKTTQYLYEGIHIVLGRPLYGLEIQKPGPVLVLTGEDTREILVARLRRLCDALELNEPEKHKIREGVRISDVSGQGFKLSTVLQDNVLPTNRVTEVIEGCGELKPVMVIIDPTVSFGIGEARVNDAEQGLVEVGRQIRRALNCCVRYVHHSGKFNARERTTDQYTGRGGSALPDGCRMVHVMQAMTADDWTKATGWQLQPGESAIRLARPKQSYCAPQPDILLHRTGFAFRHYYEEPRQISLPENCARVLKAIAEAVAAGSYPTQNSLEALNLLPRAELRGAIATLIADNTVEYADRPSGTGRGPKTFLRPANRAGADSPDKAPTP